ncbi:hypothetical protein HZH68_012609 [Vespula germanica]|uniref:Uncharacterized protein n=1 Tax=Vespula germanica TaxID=30212 RepID=A0A834MXE5_VESGE|nr:hypothetical protein HZH68_012609 [Vespula germanica]
MAAGGGCSAAAAAPSSSVLRTAVNSFSYSFAQPGSFGWFGPSTIGCGVVRREGGGRNEQRPKRGRRPLYLSLQPPATGNATAGNSGHRSQPRSQGD